jgi:TPR repeat protein
MKTAALLDNSRPQDGGQMGCFARDSKLSVCRNSLFINFLQAAAVSVMLLAARCPAGVPVSHFVSVDDLRARAEAGDTAAQVQIGELYFTGEGAPFDKAEAARWYRMAADKGNAKAAFLLGFMYEVGEGVPKYKVEAAKWYREAAENGDARAQFLLASMYSRGDGVAQDSMESARWLRAAAEQGNVQAQVVLLKRYYDGEGLLGGKEEAVKWFRNAAEQGNAFAQFQLGVMYNLGNGVPKDDVEALAWLNLSASKGDHDYVKARDNLEKELGRTLALQGQERSRELLKKVDIAVAARESAVVAQDGQ